MLEEEYETLKMQNEIEAFKTIVNAEAARWYDSYAEHESELTDEYWWEEYEEYMREYITD